MEMDLLSIKSITIKKDLAEAPDWKYILAQKSHAEIWS